MLEWAWQVLKILRILATWAAAYSVLVMQSASPIISFKVTLKESWIIKIHLERKGNLLLHMENFWNNSGSMIRLL
jgi:hypothetical protein